MPVVSKSRCLVAAANIEQALALQQVLQVNSVILFIQHPEEVISYTLGIWCNSTEIENQDMKGSSSINTEGPFQGQCCWVPSQGIQSGLTLLIQSSLLSHEDLIPAINTMFAFKHGTYSQGKMPQVNNMLPHITYLFGPKGVPGAISREFIQAELTQPTIFKVQSKDIFSPETYYPVCIPLATSSLISTPAHQHQVSTASACPAHASPGSHAHAPSLAIAQPCCSTLPRECTPALWKGGGLRGMAETPAPGGQLRRRGTPLARVSGIRVLNSSAYTGALLRYRAHLCPMVYSPQFEPYWPRISHKGRHLPRLQIFNKLETCRKWN